VKASNQQKKQNVDTSPNEGPMNMVETDENDFGDGSESSGDFGGVVSGRD